MDFLTLLGILGNMTAIALFTSPAPTFWRIFKNKTTQDFSGLPYVCTLLNCLLWILYGLPLVKPNGLLIITINGAGVVFELVYLSIFLAYCARNERVKVLQMLLATVVFYTILCLVTVFAIPYSSRKLVIGLLCVVFAISMYAAPLGVMRMVIRTRSVEFMPFFLSLFVFINGTVWSGYAVVAKDIYIAIPNGLGCLSGVVQLCLYVFYRRAVPLTIEGDGVTSDSLDTSKSNGSYIQMEKSASNKQAHMQTSKQQSGVTFVSIPLSPRHGLASQAAPGPGPDHV